MGSSRPDRRRQSADDGKAPGRLGFGSSGAYLRCEPRDLHGGAFSGAESDPVFDVDLRVVARHDQAAAQDGGDQRRRHQFGAHRNDRACRDAYRCARTFFQRRHALQWECGCGCGHRLGAGIEHAPPMITRGVLFDVGGASHLPPGQTVMPDDLKRAADAGGFTVEAGDIALIRTGWGRYFGTDNARYLEGEPGIDVPAAKWLIDQGIAAIGADNMAVEVLPNPDKTIMMPVHQFCLAECGVYLIENLMLEEMAQDKVHAACFILLATKFRGATGSPVRPIAMI